MVVIGVGSISVYFNSIEAFVLYHLFDVGAEIVLVIERSLSDGLELLFGGCICSVESRLLASSLLVMRHVYLLNLHCREEIAHLSDNVGSSTHGHRGLDDG